MRAVTIFFPLLLLAQPLPLSVRYDPFKSTVRHKSEEKTQVQGALVRPKTHLRLMAIYDDKAMIDGRFVKVGERIGDFLVRKIGDGYVVLSNKRIKRILYFAQQIVRMEKR